MDQRKSVLCGCSRVATFNDDDDDDDDDDDELLCRPTHSAACICGKVPGSDWCLHLQYNTWYALLWPCAIAHRDRASNYSPSAMGWSMTEVVKRFALFVLFFRCTSFPRL